MVAKDRCIKRREENWLEFEETKREVDDIDRKLCGTSDFEKQTVAVLNDAWKSKCNGMERLRSLEEKIIEVEGKLKAKKSLDIISFAALLPEVQVSEQRCTQVTDQCCSGIRDQLVARLHRAVKAIIEEAGQRLQELSSADEANLQQAAAFLKVFFFAFFSVLELMPSFFFFFFLSYFYSYLLFFIAGLIVFFSCCFKKKIL